MELPKRKKIRLEKYDYSSCGAYFITICTQNSKCLLGRVVGDDAHIVPRVKLSPIGEIANRYIATIPGVEKYVIMPNHIHMIIMTSNADGSMWASTPTSQSVSQLVKSFKILVTKQAGFSIWQRSFYDHIIRDECDYLEIWQYIDENPIKWGEIAFMKGNITVKYLQNYIKLKDFNPELKKDYFLKLSEEVGELSRAMRKNMRPADETQIKETVEEEIWDVVYYALAIANCYEIDVEKVIPIKEKLNNEKYNTGIAFNPNE